MGFFEVLCGASGIPLSGDAKIVLLAETKAGRKDWKPVSLPLTGCYDRLGSIDLPEKLDAHAKAIEKLCAGFLWEHEVEEHDLATSLGELSRCMNEGVWGRSNGRRVSYAIFDANVYTAIAKLAPAGRKQPTMALVEALFPIEDLRTTIYGGLRKPSLHALQPSAAALARFLSFGIKLSPIDVTAGDQLCGYDVGPEMSAKPHLVKAKKKWAKYPTVLAAIAINEKEWRALDDDDDDDDDE